MIPQMQQQWRVAARPLGRELALSDFELVNAPVASPDEGQVLVRSLYLDFAPAQKSWMENQAGYRKPVEIGDVMPGSGAGVVVQSRDPRFAEGDVVMGYLGWAQYPVVNAADLTKAPSGVDIPSLLGVLGVSGKTAYAGLLNIGKPKPGDTLVISGAGGAVGSIVGQIGKLAGCRVIGIAGGAEKCAWLVETVGFDEAIDYRNEDLKARLRALCPQGIDIFYDNVGGEVLNLALARLAFGARVVICGAVSRYNFNPRDASQMPEGPRNYFNVVATGASIQGFVVHHFAHQFPAIEARLTAWLRNGDLKGHDDIQHGFEAAPATLMRLFSGANRGKQLLKIADL